MQPQCSTRTCRPLPRLNMTSLLQLPSTLSSTSTSHPHHPTPNVTQLHCLTGMPHIVTSPIHLRCHRSDPCRCSHSTPICNNRRPTSHTHCPSPRPTPSHHSDCTPIPSSVPQPTHASQPCINRKTGAWHSSLSCGMSMGLTHLSIFCFLTLPMQTCYSSLKRGLCRRKMPLHFQVTRVFPLPEHTCMPKP